MVHYRSISEWFRDWQQPAPEHPLISVLEVDLSATLMPGPAFSAYCDFYCIALKRVSGAQALKLKYGQQPYDFNEGIMSFMAPGQVVSLAVDKEIEVKQSGWYVIVHPCFLYGIPLSSAIRRYAFWGYATN